MGGLYLIESGAEITRRRKLVPRGQMIEAWQDHYVADDYWMGEGSKSLLDFVGPPVPAKLSLDAALVHIYYGPRLSDLESLPSEESLRARVLSAHGIAVAWITVDESGQRAVYQPHSPTDPIFFLRRPGGGAAHIWRLFATRHDAVSSMTAYYGADPEAVEWARAIPADSYEQLLERYAIRDDTEERRLVAALEAEESARTLVELAIVYLSQGRYAEAEPRLLRALAIQDQSLGRDHADLAGTLARLAALYAMRGEYAGAEPLYRRLLGILERTLGPEHDDVASTLEAYAALLVKLGREDDAVRVGARARSIQAKRAGGRP